ncbi:MAG: phospho-N-acetylmuramoyl-pentapeptide-transferase [Acidimicrobiia bacterium]|nr:phospho-N-acetylmuramoyl-pentapeptide-transferase [Acidimicrobiia bacterium]
MGVSLVGTKFLIDWLSTHRIGQPIREDGPEGHVTKAGTPTMGGLAIVAAALVSYGVSDFYRGIYTRTGIFVMLAIAGAGAVGLLDDYLKVKRERNLGLTKRTKILGLLVVAVGFAYLTGELTAVHTDISFTRFDEPGIDIGNITWAAVAILWVLGSTNAVNLTDGLDGLAAGSAVFAFAAYVVIGFWAFRYPEVYEVNHALDLAVVAAAMVGAISGFLWWNAAPAQIFMGDTGSLAVGAGLACLALTTNTMLLLPVIGGVFVIETLSVMLQIGSFRLFGGRRVFRMAPLHHHFELLGWPETTVIVRFWILAGLFTALGLGLYYADFLSTGVLT